MEKRFDSSSLFDNSNVLLERDDGGKGDENETVKMISKQLSGFCEAGASFFGLAISLTIGIISLVIGLHYKDSDCEKDLHIWLIVLGSTKLVISALITIKVVQLCFSACILVPITSGNNTAEKGLEACNKCTNSLISIPNCLIGCFVLAWLVVGIVWIAQTDQSVGDCPAELYDTALAMLIICWLLYFCVIILVLILVPTMICCGIMGVLALIGVSESYDTI